MKSPKVSIIIPCRNEKGYIGKCLDSILTNGYPHESLEIFVIDGMSTDGTRNILNRYSTEYSFIKMLDNEEQITSCALNIGIKESTAQAIMWLSAHNDYEKDYISTCVKYMEEYGVDSAGGTINTVSRGNGFFACAISEVLSSRFGVGNSHFRTGLNKPRYADTVFGCCYKKSIFDRVGLFNEDLVRGQDLEFSMRMKSAEIKTLLVPELKSVYYARSDFIEFCQHNFVNGMWAILPFKHSSVIPISYRHIIPLLSVICLVALIVFSFTYKPSLLLMILLIAMYVFISLYYATRISLKKRKTSYLFTMPIIFASLHLTYGVGSLVGTIKLLFSGTFWKKVFKRDKPELSSNTAG